MAVEKKSGLRRVGAWCVRLVGRVSKSHAQEADGSPTDNESWITSQERASTGFSRKSNESCSSGGDRAPSYLEPVTHTATISTSSNPSQHRHYEERMLHTQRQEKDWIRKTHQSRATTSASQQERSATTASQRLHEAGRCVQTQRMTSRKLRELQYERSMQQPLNHIQIRRLVQREKGDPVATSSPSFVTIRKARLPKETSHRLEMLGLLRPKDSVPPWVPHTTDRWSCEPTVDEPWCVSSFDKKMRSHQEHLAAVRKRPTVLQHSAVKETEI